MPEENKEQQKQNVIKTLFKNSKNKLKKTWSDVVDKANQTISKNTSKEVKHDIVLAKNAVNKFGSNTSNSNLPVTTNQKDAEFEEEKQNKSNQELSVDNGNSFEEKMKDLEAKHKRINKDLALTDPRAAFKLAALQAKERQDYRYSVDKINSSEKRVAEARKELYDTLIDICKKLGVSGDTESKLSQSADQQIKYAEQMSEIRNGMLDLEDKISDYKKADEKVFKDKMNYFNSTLDNRIKQIKISYSEEYTKVTKDFFTSYDKLQYEKLNAKKPSELTPEELEQLQHLKTKKETKPVMSDSQLKQLEERNLEWRKYQVERLLRKHKMNVSAYTAEFDFKVKQRNLRIKEILKIQNAIKGKINGKDPIPSYLTNDLEDATKSLTKMSDVVTNVMESLKDNIKTHFENKSINKEKIRKGYLKKFKEYLY